MVVFSNSERGVFGEGLFKLGRLETDRHHRPSIGEFRNDSIHSIPPVKRRRPRRHLFEDISESILYKW